MKKELEVVMVVHIYTTGTCASNFALRYIPSPVNRDNTALTLDIASTFNPPNISIWPFPLF